MFVMSELYELLSAVNVCQTHCLLTFTCLCWGSCSDLNVKLHDKHDLLSVYELV